MQKILIATNISINNENKSRNIVVIMAWLLSDEHSFAAHIGYGTFSGTNTGQEWSKMALRLTAELMRFSSRLSLSSVVTAWRYVTCVMVMRRKTHQNKTHIRVETKRSTGRLWFLYH